MKTILVIEDDPILSQMYFKLFDSENYNALIGQDGVEGLALAKSEKPSLILLDVMLPKMSGIEVLQNLKSDPETKNIPVVILTNLAGEKDAEQALLMGAQKYLIKSENKPSQVEAIVNDILSHTQPAP